MHKNSEIMSLIHENFWTIISFMTAKPVIIDIMNNNFQGEWKTLRNTIHDQAEVKADRALLEMATQLRILDDVEGINDLFIAMDAPSLGTVNQSDGKNTELYFRDMTNKIIHAAQYHWNHEERKITCQAKKHDKWIEAEIDMVRLMYIVGKIST
ncbi:hypothetical protein EIB18_02155 [Caulobacter vibrioides]|uniref:Uncharacterized protein n=2 Tax=Caulobacter vibrioides TaxID=155892 RepID=Q9AB14_CAUVC|nr:hypothetical protein [Caulobacter vibrioides]YP_002515800.1 hypothetical protein CCNA_00425 [Caulobacter vibrioides NA1000]QBQ56904.1 hypothetical protein EUX21_00510 [synthetic Caulobacter sp. 'ethensis']AAK22407.1 hypothetical protein CC_0420 [Caulobacter vibrioides CB15]ACL93892.1 hypothetical protein CCNA_00425 [Caulobacter vibrioides NA1000]ATC27249.1 hypothetical protein CA607_02165 [Caulobacter vibrioides]AZH11631.1 hypothetical protein EIB18_02155 [Caulobacter vibrioides]